jgi:very-short-patch-repair endonuclease
MKHPIKIVCPIHGEFTQKAHSHYLGHQCFKCAGSEKINNDEIINQFIKKHGNKYNYKNVEYKNNKTNVEIICPDHGIFHQSPYEHKRGQGCPKCSKNRRLNSDMFIDMSNDVHDFMYKYNNDYINSKTKVVIVCPKHGEFLMTPNHHLKGQGCQDCKRSIGELLIKRYLNDKKVKYVQQKFFKDLINNNKRYLFFDFYLVDLNICIEYDGIQHFKPVSMFGGNSAFIKLRYNDKLKDDYCNLNGIKLIRIPYTSIKDIKLILDVEIK